MKKIIVIVVIIIGLVSFTIIYNKNNVNKNDTNTEIKDNETISNEEIDNKDTNEVLENEENNEISKDDETFINSETNETVLQNNNKEDEISTIKEEKQTMTVFKEIPTYKEENDERYNNYKDKNNDLDLYEIVRRVNLNLDYAFYENIQDALYTDTDYLLTNKTYKLSSDFFPSDLEKVNINYATNYNIEASSHALTYFYKMCDDAKNLGLTIKTLSAYRTYSYQEALYNGYLKTDPVSVVDTYSARPGHSEHQTGLAFDIYNTKISYTDFDLTDEYIWVKDNAHKYGFIIRYEEDKEYITGYKFEPWHIRYVGIDIATYIYNNNITLEDYLLNKK